MEHFGALKLVPKIVEAFVQAYSKNKTICLLLGHVKSVGSLMNAKWIVDCPVLKTT